MKIRKATTKDLKKVAEIFKAEFEKKPYNEKWSTKVALQKIKEYHKSGYIFVLEIKKQIIGFIIAYDFIWHDGKRAFIDEIVVSSEYQGKGFGKKLMRYAEDFFKKKKVKNVELMAVKNSKASKIYSKLGYKEEKFVLMVKPIK